MTPELEAKLQGLEEQLAADPESESLREEILFEYLGPGLAGEPRRLHHILEYVRRFPRTFIARCPYVHVSPAALPAAFAQIEQEWLRLQAENPGDADLAIGLAALVARHDRDRAVRLLEEAQGTSPEHGELWLELGRVHPKPTRRLMGASESTHSRRIATESTHLASARRNRGPGHGSS